MSDSVKMVFKSLFGTILFMVMTSVCIELFNVNITGLQVRHMTKMAARQAAELFTQETYKIDNGGGTVLAKDIKNKDGGIYLRGDFYNGKTNMYDIYEDIYGDESHFVDWCSHADGSDYYVDGARYKIEKTPRGSLRKSYTNLEAMLIGVRHDYTWYLTPANMPGWDDADDSDKVKKWTLYSRGQAFYELCYTPINLGIPYLDAIVMNKMYKWNLAQLASNCDSDSIQTEKEYTYTDLYVDPNINATDYFVNYKGFKIFADKARITDYQYYVFDLTKSADRTAYTKLTNNKVKTSGGGEGIKVNEITGSKKIKGSEDFQEEDNYVAVVSITYGVPIEYIGITPIRTIFNWVWGREVAGMTRADGSQQGNEGNPIQTSEGWHEQWNTASEDLKGMQTSDYMKYQDASGYTSADEQELLENTLFTTGYLTYTIVN